MNIFEQRVAEVKTRVTDALIRAADNGMEVEHAALPAAESVMGLPYEAPDDRLTVEEKAFRAYVTTNERMDTCDMLGVDVTDANRWFPARVI